MLLFLLLLPSPLSAQWTGFPGQPWSQADLTTVKAKILRVFLMSGSVYNEYLALHPEESKPNTNEDYPNAAKVHLYFSCISIFYSRPCRYLDLASMTVLELRVEEVAATAASTL